MQRLGLMILLAPVGLVVVACGGADAERNGGGDDGSANEDPRCPSEPPGEYAVASEEGIACHYDVGCIVDLVTEPRDSPLCTDGECYDFAWAPTEAHTCTGCGIANDGEPCANVGESCDYDGCYGWVAQCLPDHTWSVEITFGDPSCV